VPKSPLYNLNKKYRDISGSKPDNIRAYIRKIRKNDNQKKKDEIN
jgi:hypothetical protein